MMMYKTIAFREGQSKGEKDKTEHYAPRVDHYIKRWAEDFNQFNAGYMSAFGLWP